MTHHKLVFIGQVGVGKKAAAICHLVGLTANPPEKKTVRGNVKDDPGRRAADGDRLRVT